MPKEVTPGKASTRRYSPDEKAAAVRMVRTLRAELGTEHGTGQRVATQLGYGVESVRSWVRQADIDANPCSGRSRVPRDHDAWQQVIDLSAVASAKYKACGQAVVAFMLLVVAAAAFIALADVAVR